MGKNRTSVCNLLSYKVMHDCVSPDSGVGAGIDSYYEYLLKAYILLGDDLFLQRFNIVSTHAHLLAQSNLMPFCLRNSILSQGHLRHEAVLYFYVCANEFLFYSDKLFFLNLFEALRLTVTKHHKTVIISSILPLCVSHLALCIYNEIH